MGVLPPSSSSQGSAPSSTPNTPTSGNPSKSDVERFKSAMNDNSSYPANEANMIPDYTPKNVLYDSGDAVDYYFYGNGDPAELSDSVKQKIMNHPDVQAQIQKNINGTGKQPFRVHINLETDLDWETFHIGDTMFSYTETCSDGRCTTTFTAPIFDKNGAPDRFEDPLNLGFELPGCIPYDYKTFSWSVTYPDPNSNQSGNSNDSTGDLGLEGQRQHSGGDVSDWDDVSDTDDDPNNDHREDGLH